MAYCTTTGTGTFKFVKMIHLVSSALWIFLNPSWSCGINIANLRVIIQDCLSKNDTRLGDGESHITCTTKMKRGAISQFSSQSNHLLKSFGLESKFPASCIKGVLITGVVLNKVNANGGPQGKGGARPCQFWPAQSWLACYWTVLMLRRWTQTTSCH